MTKKESWFLPLLLIVVVGLAAYSNTFQVPFYFDDLPCIVENLIVHDLANLKNIGDYWQLGITEDIRNNIVTRIVSYLTFAANYRLHGLEVTGYHLVNLLIHLANALLVYLLVTLVRTQHLASTGQNEKRDLFALLIALLFVSHPVMTNAVTYIVQRFASLATFFALIALCAYLLSCRQTSPLRQKGLYAGALTATVLAMYTKEIAFTLPLLIALFDRTFLPGSPQQRLRRLAPFLVTMLLLPLTVIFLSSISEVTGQSPTNALNLVNIGHGSRWIYLFSQWRVIVTYLRILIFPADLHLEYDFPIFPSPGDPEVLASGLFLAALFGAGLRLLFSHRADAINRQYHRLIGLGIVWFFITLAMESSIIPLDDLLFEYRLYLPAFGFFLAITASAELLRRRLVLKHPTVNTLAASIVVILIMTLTTATILRNRTWQDELAFWQDNVDKSPNRARSRCSLANIYLQQGDLGRAISELKTAGRINPNYWVPFTTLGNIHWNLGLYTQAAADYAEAVRRGNRSREQLLKLGRAQRMSGNPEAARTTFTAILTITPDDAETLAEMRSLQL